MWGQISMDANNFTFREFRESTFMKTQIPVFVNCQTTKVPKFNHHVSMYGISETDAKIQTRLGNTKNRDVLHYSSELVIDTDSTETAEKVWSSLCKLGFTFEMWKLNNYKFFLERSDIDSPSQVMCYQDRQFVKDLFGPLEKLDISIYSHPFHLIRAKNAIHEITKAKSTLVETYKGPYCVATNDVELRIYEKPVSYNYDSNCSDWSQLQAAIEFTQGKGTNKHINLWQFGKDISKFLSEVAAEELALIYASSLEYDEYKALRAFKQGYNTGRNVC